MSRRMPLYQNRAQQGTFLEVAPPAEPVEEDEEKKSVPPPNEDDNGIVNLDDDEVVKDVEDAGGDPDVEKPPISMMDVKPTHHPVKSGVPTGVVTRGHTHTRNSSIYGNLKPEYQ
jgi:hypothetical protein